MKLPTPKTFWIFNSALAMLALGVWRAATTHGLAIDWPKTIALIIGLAIGAGYVAVYWANASARKTFMKGILLTATLGYLTVLVVAFTVNRVQTRPSRTVANVSSDGSNGNDNNSSADGSTEAPSPPAYSQEEMDSDAHSVCAAYSARTNAVNAYNLYFSDCKNGGYECSTTTANAYLSVAELAKRKITALDEQFYQKYGFSFSSRYNCD